MGANICLFGSKQIIHDGISIDHGTKKISLTVFKGDIRPGLPGCVTYIELDISDAEWLAGELLRRVKELRKENP